MFYHNIYVSLKKYEYTTILKNYWSLSGSCAKVQGVLFGKTFQNGLHMTDD